MGRQLTQAATTTGLPPTETTSARAFGAAQFDGLWIPTAALTALRPQQVLDRDPYSGHVTYFGGVDGALAVIVVQGVGDSLEHYYDTVSGLLMYARYRVPSPGVGTQVTELRWAGQP